MNPFKLQKLGGMGMPKLGKQDVAVATPPNLAPKPMNTMGSLGPQPFTTGNKMPGMNNPEHFIKPINDNLRETGAENNLRKFGNLMRFLKR